MNRFWYARREKRYDLRFD